MKIPIIKKNVPDNLIRISDSVEELDTPDKNLTFKVRNIKYVEDIPVHPKIIIRNQDEQNIFDDISKNLGELNEFEVIPKYKFKSIDIKKREMTYRLEDLEYKTEREKELDDRFERISKEVLKGYNPETDKIIYYDNIRYLSGRTAYCLYRNGKLINEYIILMS